MKSHKIRGGLTTAVAGILLYALMFFPRFSSFGTIIGIALLLVLIIGVFDWLGELPWGSAPVKENVPPPSTAELPFFLRLLAKVNIRLFYAGAALAVAGICRFSVAGTMGAAAPWSGPLLLGVGAAFILGSFLIKKPFDGNFHEGFLVFWMSFATVMAALGSQGLWDCWETHYGEVARRQLEQDDWISLFWESKWFFSKPILIFWMMNLGMSLFHVDVRPDHISAHAEWGVRFAVALTAVFVIYGVYKLLAARVSKRAGLFSAIVLSAMPLFGFMTRQAITDLPFVGFMALATVMFLLGVTVDKEAKTKDIFVPLWKNKGIRLNAFHGVIAGYLAVGIPQFLYLASRSASFRFGTYGRDDIKAVLAKNRLTQYSLSDLTHSLFGVRIGGVQDISLDWLIMGLAYLLVFILILFSIRKERRVSKLCFYGMYLFLSLSVMAKGLPGLALPILSLFGFWLVLAPWKNILSPGKFAARHWEKVKDLEIFRGGAMFLLLASPWYIAMTVRHGMSFINRFFIHDHLKRLASGVHGESGTFQYFMEQFGYAAFPLVALFPLALLAWPALFAKPSAELSEAERASMRIRLFMTSLAVVSYTLFSMMVTKFHHYVFPMIIPAAVLIGLFIDDIWQNRVSKMGLVVIAALVILGAVSQTLIVDPATKAKGVIDGHTQLVGLFIYKYSRPYPSGEAYNFFKPLLVFSILFGVLFLGWLYAARRRTAVVLTMFAALAFSHFLNHHYMVKLAPHWTQKHLIDEYYAMRDTDDERLIAFQMNWKGENFYTGNRVIPYVSTKKKDFDKWVDKHRRQRHFFITEPSRFRRMDKRIKAASGSLRPLFDDTCDKDKIDAADKSTKRPSCPICNKYKIGVAEKL